MILASCKRGDEIILPRNVHRSVINALILCGAVPVYVNPDVNQRLGISLGMRREQVAKTIAEHPTAVAVLVNTPTYYDVCSNLRAIVKIVHAAGFCWPKRRFSSMTSTPPYRRIWTERRPAGCMRPGSAQRRCPTVRRFTLRRNRGELPCTVCLGGPTCLAGNVIGNYIFATPLREGALGQSVKEQIRKQWEWELDGLLARDEELDEVFEKFYDFA